MTRAVFTMDSDSGQSPPEPMLGVTTFLTSDELVAQFEQSLSEYRLPLYDDHCCTASSWMQCLGILKEKNKSDQFFADVKNKMLARVMQNECPPIEPVDRLLKMGADPETSLDTDYIATALSVASQNENLLRVFLKNGANPDAYHSCDQSLLRRALSDFQYDSKTHKQLEEAAHRMNLLFYFGADVNHKIKGAVALDCVPWCAKNTPLMNFLNSARARRAYRMALLLSRCCVRRGLPVLPLDLYLYIVQMHYGKLVESELKAMNAWSSEELLIKKGQDRKTLVSYYLPMQK